MINITNSTWLILGNCEYAIKVQPGDYTVSITGCNIQTDIAKRRIKEKLKYLWMIAKILFKGNKNKNVD